MLYNIADDISLSAIADGNSLTDSINKQSALINGRKEYAKHNGSILKGKKLNKPKLKANNRGKYENTGSIKNIEVSIASGESSVTFLVLKHMVTGNNT